jgi:DNA polymerase III alpha subunit
MRFAKSKHIPAQGRGSAADSIVAYVLGITRVDPIRHELLFERFINEGRTAYPDVDIDFSSERREEVIQYVYERYGAEHTGMVCNLVTYRARSAVREVGHALGFPRPLVDRVAKALETYDSVMVRRDLEAEGGFGQFFARPEAPVAAEIAALTGERGLTDAMGQLNHGRGGRWGSGAAERGDGRMARAEDLRRVEGAPPTETSPAAREDPPRPERWLGGDEADRWLRDQVGRFAPGEPPGDTTDPGLGGSSVGRRWRERRSTPPADTGTWEGAPGSKPAARRGHGPDDEGGPGDSTASVAWLRAGRGTGYGTEGWAPYREIARQIDPETGVLIPDDRRYDPRQLRRIDDVTDVELPVGGPSALDRPIDRNTPDDGGGPGDESAVARRWAREQALARQDPHSSVARIEPEPPPHARPGSVAGLSDWERWLELCARIDGFPRHLSIHSGGMLVTAAPLIDIAPIERATMKDRVVVQYDKRDVETMKLIKLDLLGLGMLAAIDECVQLIEHDCAVCLDLDRIPEEIPEVFEMLQAADTVGVFQVESRAQMQTLPKSRPQSLDDLVVEVAIIRPGPIQGNAVHPYLRRKQGLEPVTYLHPSLEPILHDTLGVILYQEQVMKIAIDVAGFTPAGSDGFRRAMGTWRSTREMEKLHAQFVDGCVDRSGMARDDAEELFRRCAAFASFGFAKSHAAAFARTAYESSFLKLFYPAQFTVGLINAQPMGFYPVEVLVNDAKRHGVAVLPVDVNRSSYRTTTEWVGRPGWAMAGAAGDDGSHDADDGEPLPEGCGIVVRPAPVRSPACVLPRASERDRWAAETMTGWGIRLGLHLVKGIGEEQGARLDEELARGPYTSLADVVERTGLAEEVVERLIRVGALDSLGRPRRELLWQLREVAGASKGRVDGKARSTKGITRAAGRPMDLRLPATDAPSLPPLTEPERLGDAYAVVGLDARRQAVSLFRGALDRLGAVPNGALNGMRPGSVRLGGLVVTRQHPMTARGTVFLALEDETGMVNVTLWPDTWQRLRSVVRRHALLLVDGDLQREGEVVNVIARSVRPLVEAASEVGGPAAPAGVKQIGQAGMRRLGRPPAASAERQRLAPSVSGLRPASAAGGLHVAAALLLRLRLLALRPVRVREVQEAAVPGGHRGEQRGADRRDRRGIDDERLRGLATGQQLAGGRLQHADVAGGRHDAEHEAAQPAGALRREPDEEPAGSRRRSDEQAQREVREVRRGVELLARERVGSGPVDRLGQGVGREDVRDRAHDRDADRREDGPVRQHLRRGSKVAPDVERAHGPAERRGDRRALRGLGWCRLGRLRRGLRATVDRLGILGHDRGLLRPVAAACLGPIGALGAGHELLQRRSRRAASCAAGAWYRLPAGRALSRR